MKIHSSKMSHNACYDLNTGRWLVSPRDIVLLDLSNYDGSCYPAYVRSVDLYEITVVRLKDREPFTFTALNAYANGYIKVTSYCKNIFMRSDDVVFTVGAAVIDKAFEGTFEWYIQKFDFTRGRAFIVREISGRTLGHWVDMINLSKVD